MAKFSVFKKTKDDWYPSYALGSWHRGVEPNATKLVEVIYNGNITAYDPKVPAVWRTCVWGGDDMGMEYDCDTEAEAWNMFLKVIAMDTVDQKALDNLGYVRA